MKIVQINAVYQYSSIGRTTMEMHTYLKSQGYESFVFCTNCQNKENNIYKIGCTADYKLHALLSRITGKQGFFSSLTTKFLLKDLSRIAPDIVILRNLHNNYINLQLVLTFLSQNRIPTIVVLHDCWMYTGFCVYYSAEKCEKWKQRCNHCCIIKKYKKSLLFDTSSYIFDIKKEKFSAIKNLAVIGVSDWVTNEVKQAPIFKNAQLIKRIYNWIDLDIFHPYNKNPIRPSLNLSSGDFVILGVAQSWTIRKGLNEFIQLAKRNPQKKFVMVGDISSRVKLPRNIISVGIINNTQTLAYFYSMADIFLNLSVQETFGKVTAEALSCGTPIIVQNLTAIPELCGEGCGYVIKNNIIDEAQQYIDTIFKDSKKKYTEQCVAFSQHNFNKRTNLIEYEKLFKQMLENRIID